MRGELQQADIQELRSLLKNQQKNPWATDILKATLRKKSEELKSLT